MRRVPPTDDDLDEALSEVRGITTAIRAHQGHVEHLADQRARKVARLRERGVPVPVIAASLGTSVQAVYTWKPKPTPEPR